MRLEEMSIEQLMNLLASLYEKEKEIKAVIRKKLNE
jgi:hypothetical protein